MNWRMAARLWVVMCVALAASVQARETYQFSQSSVNANQSDWRGLDEGQVFFRMLTHVGDGQSWTIKIGKGGQIYSIKTPELGELIAYQRAKDGQWMDEVFQHVWDMPPNKIKKGPEKNTVVDGDIHQAGYYVTSDLDDKLQILPKSVYSPLFAYAYDPKTTSVSYVTWPQHAHLPRRYAENLFLLAQTITDRGGGVIEISGEVSKWGGARNDMMSMPWSGFRTRTLPTQIISERDGRYRVDNRPLQDKSDMTWLADANTGGWVALAASDSPSARGLGIVFGKTARAGEGSKSRVRWGTYGDPRKPDGGTIVAVMRQIGLEAGESLRFRYFVVLGTVAEIQAKAKVLESEVVLERTNRSLADARNLRVCGDPEKGLKRNCESGETPVFNALAEFVPGARPLFLLKKAGTSDYLVTDDPYEISFDPTDGTTAYVDLLGWAIPETRTSGGCGFQSLREAVAGSKRPVRLGRKTSDLRVRPAVPRDCPRPG